VSRILLELLRWHDVLALANVLLACHISLALQYNHTVEYPQLRAKYLRSHGGASHLLVLGNTIPPNARTVPYGKRGGILRACNN
jgi:hypothetical protein